MATNSNDRGAWGSRLGFILAAAGSAVGLGNVWKFPYITGENGGGLFVLIYLVCIALVGLPIMVAELMIGRAAQKQPVVAFEELEGKKTGWSLIGWMGILAGFIILSYYIVVAGWAMDYTFKSMCDFTRPIHEEAAVEATKYRGTAKITEMRKLLVDKKAEHDARGPLSSVTGKLPRSYYKTHERFQAALEAGGNRAILLSEPGMRGIVDEVEKVQEEQQRIRGESLERARAHYAALSDDVIRNEAQTAVRREHVSKGVTAVFMGLLTDGWTSTFWAFVVMLITVALVSLGVSSGIEKLCKILMPTLIGLMVFMVLFGMTRSGFSEAVSFVFKPDPSKLKVSGVLEALGHAFFTLSLGMGAMITYGSYQKTRENLLNQALLISALDTGIALLACMLMFPIVFSYGGEPGAGPGLVFISMPLAFSEMGGFGLFLSILFFGLLVFAALTSAVSLLEVVASYFIDRLGWTRRKAASILGLAIFGLGICSAFAASKEFWFSSWESGYHLNFFDSVDLLASNWLLPLGGLFIAIYAGWIMPKRIMEAELEGTGVGFISVYLILLRFVAPGFVLVVLAHKAGVIDFEQLFYNLFHNP